MALTGYKERFQDKKRYPKLPRLKREDLEPSPWGVGMSPALLRIVNERREKEQLEKESARKSSNQALETR